MRKIFTLWLITAGYFTSAQNFEVPDQMDFAGIKLKIKQDARREIQTDVDALTQNKTYYLKKLSKVEEYFPIIERIFREEGLPDDFKYLVIQESAFIPDAVSTSNAVGFWQFKMESALEVGMRVDNKIDERMHIIASTRGAARYIQKNNYFFNNWLNALQAYQMGAGGAMQVLGDRDNGAKTMSIDKNTYWYVKKFLAHKIAFESGIGRYPTDAHTLVEYTRSADKTLKEISREVDVDEASLEDYNKWLKSKKIPGDKDYVVIVPLKKVGNVKWLADSKSVVPDFDKVQQKSYSTVAKKDSKFPFLITINALDGILAGYNETPATIAEKGEISVRNFLRYNDLKEGSKIIEDQIYYLEKKRNRSRIYFHTVEKNETVWSISQKYGIKASKISRFNRLKKGENLADGLILWLHKKRPKSIPVEFRKVEKPVELLPVETSTVEIKEKDDPIQEPSDLEKDILTQEDSITIAPAETTQVEKQEVDSVVIPTDTLDTDSLVQMRTEKAPSENQKTIVIHTVIQGETLYSISRKYGITVQELIDWNSLSADSVLKMDQELEIRKENSQIDSELNKSYTEHIVVVGDTLYRISKLYDVSLEDLLKWNNKISSELKVGEIVLIKKK